MYKVEETCACGLVQLKVRVCSERVQDCANYGEVLLEHNVL